MQPLTLPRTSKLHCPLCREFRDQRLSEHRRALTRCEIAPHYFIYRWAFKPNNIVSHKLFRALHDHEVTKKYEVRHKNNFQPTVLRGSASGVGQDSFAFYPVNGVYSLILDDDNCYCQTTLEMGYRICTNSDSTSTFGVDMADRGCGQPTTKKSLFLFFRTTRKPHSFGLVRLSLSLSRSFYTCVLWCGGWGWG